MADVTIRYEPSGEERVVDEAAVPFFPGWVELDKAGRKKAHQSTTPADSKEN